MWKLKSQTSGSFRTSTGDIDIEEIRSHIPKISEKITREIKKKIHKDIEQIRSIISSQVNKEMTTLMKGLLSVARKDIHKNTGA